MRTGRPWTAMSETAESEPSSQEKGLTILSDDEMEHLCRQKCRDSSQQFSEKLYERFLSILLKNPLKKAIILQDAGIGPHTAKAISQLASIHRDIKLIDLQGNKIGDEGAIYLARAVKSSTTLLALNLSSCGIGDVGLTALMSEIAHSLSITEFRIGGNRTSLRNSFGSQSSAYLERALRYNRVLTELDLSTTEINTDTIAALSRGMAANFTLQTLDMSNNIIRTKGANMLFSALKTSMIRVLHLTNAQINDDFTTQAAAFLTENTSIEVLNLTGNNLGAHFCAAIAQPLALSKNLIELNLSKNPLGGKSASLLASAIAINQKLEVLRLYGCRLEPYHMTSFGKDIATNHSLKVLDLGGNPITDEGVDMIKMIVEFHNNLTELYIDLCDITDVGAKKIFEKIEPSKKLSVLSMRNNLLHDGSLVYDLLKENTQLTTFNLESNDIDYKMSLELQTLVTANKKLYKQQQYNRMMLEAESLPQVLQELENTKLNISMARTALERKQKELEEVKTANTEAEKSIKAKKEELEKRYDEICQQVVGVQEQNMNRSDEVADIRAKKTNELSGLEHKIDREREKYRIDCLALATIEGNIIAETKRQAVVAEELNKQYIEAKQLYEDRKMSFIAAFQIEKNKQGSSPQLLNKSPGSKKQKK